MEQLLRLGTHENSWSILSSSSLIDGVAICCIAVEVLLSAWGIFIRLNRYAKELEPEAMADAKGEDKKLEG